ncbi:UPF0057-domain-containing protein [Periconia macrospinosa]|uniref:UPF0057-domain-containing protein n=1 Tax=Periconia macrospinosa TaxID=97972 RepID=A0A2V1D8S7_9PLEO|nr:UPF0057-domain-containing protein [Periconia macrospinosa]
MAFTASDIIKLIFAIFLPPLGVFLERGCNADFLINILLTILGYIPVRLFINALYLLSSSLPNLANVLLFVTIGMKKLTGASCH